MNFFSIISDLLYRRQKALGIIAVFLFLSLVAFRFNNRKIKLIWGDYPAIALFLAFIVALIAVIWLKIEKQKTQALITNLKEKAAEESGSLTTKLNELSTRQKEVFNLIIGGKSNKEITAMLNIELSTLKTHINQVYKILGIKKRKEAQLLEKQINSGK